MTRSRGVSGSWASATACTARRIRVRRCCAAPRASLARLASKSPLAVWGTKEHLLYSRDHSVADSLRYMAAWQSGMFQPTDMMEEFAAKADKRAANFEGLPKRQ